MTKLGQSLFPKKAFTSIIFGTILILAIVLLSACGGGSSPLVGRWEAVSVEFIQDGESSTETLDQGELGIEFFSDGNGAFIERHHTDRFTWSAENGRLMITDNRDTSIVDYSISRSTLTITFEDRWGTEIMTLNRVN